MPLIFRWKARLQDGSGFKAKKPNDRFAIKCNPSMVEYGLMAEENAARSVGIRHSAWIFIASLIRQNVVNKQSKASVAMEIRSKVGNHNQSLQPFNETLLSAACALESGQPFEMESLFKEPAVLRPSGGPFAPFGSPQGAS
jgi:hypothetical protein